MDPKSEEGIFLGYSTNSRAFRVFNSRTSTVMESINVVIEDTYSVSETDADPHADSTPTPSDVLEEEIYIDKVEN